jgi:hypothetical protein
MPALSVWLRPQVLAGAFLAVAIVLSSCSENSPASPTKERTTFGSQAQPALDVSAQGRIVALEVETRARFRRDGTLEVRIWALCRTGYEVAESGPLSVTQPQGEREAYGEGFLRAQLGGCSGRWEGERVVVQQFEEPRFRSGPARVSVTFAVVESDDPDGNPHQVSVVKQLSIR